MDASVELHLRELGRLLHSGYFSASISHLIDIVSIQESRISTLEQELETHSHGPAE